MKPLTKKCQLMLEAVKEAGEARRHVNSRSWHVGGLCFHEFTGDALARRGLLEHFVGEHDGNHYDRYRPVTPQQRP